MFKLLDRRYDRELLRPRNAIAAVVSVFMIGVGAGILIGRRNWDPLEWLQVAFCGVVTWSIFRPVFREFYSFLKDRWIHSL
jgi:hypothetical protein